MVHRRRDNLGFTLIELVVVLTIITIALGMAAPSLRGWSDGAKLRDAVDTFIATTQYARSQAILTASEYRITIDATGTTYSLDPQSGDAGQMTELPVNFYVSILSGGENGAIVFYPDSRCTPAAIVFTSAKGAQATVAASFPASSFAKAGGTP